MKMLYALLGNFSLVIEFYVVRYAGVIITADQRSVARNELTTDRTKFILSDQFDRMIFMFDLQLSYFHLYMCVLGFHAMKHIAQM